jgi:hypothetical protein
MLVNSSFHTPKIFSKNHPQFGNVPSKTFASHVLGRKSSNNTGLNGRPDVSGRPWRKNFNSLTRLALVLLPHKTFGMQSCWNNSWWELKAIINTGCPETAFEFQKSLKTRVYETGVLFLRQWKDAGGIRAPDLAAQHYAVFQLDIKHDSCSF